MEENIKLKCQDCGIDYEKPASFKGYDETTKNVYFRYSMMYCDKCRVKKEKNALMSLPKFLSVLSVNKEVMSSQDKDQLKLEIEHIFDSGANEIRVFEMVCSFIERRYAAKNERK